MGNGELGSCLKELKYRFYRKTHYTTKGNRDLEILSSPIPVNGLKIAVYSCITDGYDTVIEPFCSESGIDYFLFTDGELSNDSHWKKIDITQLEEYKNLSPVQLNRKIKMIHTVSGKQCKLISFSLCSNDTICRLPRCLSGSAPNPLNRTSGPDRRVFFENAYAD